MTDRADVELVDDHWRVVVSPAHGFLIRAADDVATGARAFWARPAPHPAQPSRDLGPPGPPSVDTFHDGFTGGWFAMFPAAGFTGELDGRVTHFHGELARLPWELCEHRPAVVEARADTVHTPFEVVRRVILNGGELRVETEALNAGDVPVPYLFGEHPCFDRATFAGGRLLLDAAAAWVPAPAYQPDRARLRPGERVDWPAADPLDLSEIPEHPDGRRDHVCVELASARIGLTAPRFGRELTLEVDLATTPHLLLSEAFGDGWDMLAIEPVSAPGRGVEDAIAAGAVRTLAPGARLRTALAMRFG